MGDAVCVQDTQSGQWSLKGVISDVIEHDDSTSKTYQVTADNGGVYLGKGRFIKLRILKVKKNKRVTFAPWVVGGA